MGLRIVAVYAGLEIAILIVVAAMDTKNGVTDFLKRLWLTLLHLVPAGLVALAIMAVSWPWSVLAPGNILLAIDTFRHFPINLWTRLNGVVMRAAHRLLADHLGRWPGHAFLAACAALWLVHLGTLVRLPPYEVAAYNSLVGGVSGAVGRYEFDYHSNSIREAATQLSQLVAEEEENGFRDPRNDPPYWVSVCAEQIQVDEYLSSSFKMTTN